MPEHLPKICNEIYKNLMSKIIDDRISVFLIGASLQRKDSVRYQIYNILIKNKSICTFFPEYIFTEVFYNSKIDFLSLENMLAESVNAIIICLESYGSFAELGAFVNADSLREKIFLISDKKYEKARSFVRLGPIQLLKQKNRDSVYWHDFTDNDYNKVVSKLIKVIKKKSSKLEINDFLNLKFIEIYLLTIIYCNFEVSMTELIQIFKYVIDINKIVVDIKKTLIMLRATIDSLFAQKCISKNEKYYNLTASGKNKLFGHIEKNKKIINFLLDKYRLNMIQYNLRIKNKLNKRRQILDMPFGG